MGLPQNTRKQLPKRGKWARLLLTLAGIVGLGIAGVGATFWFEWQGRAAQFDFSKLSEMESASQIYDKDGELIGRIFIQNRDQKPLRDISVALQKAVISAEDARFYQHEGVDYFGIARAVTRNFQSGRARQGASTLTQQLARNTFPKELPSDDRSIKRKLSEMFVAWEIEKRIPKKEILEHYLNRVFFGSGFFGAEAAAQGYFGKPARDLNVSEAAMLAGLLRSPNNLSPWRNLKACMDSRSHVLSRMRELGAITNQEYQLAIADSPQVKNRKRVSQESYIANVVSAFMAKRVGRENSVSDGYRIYTTIDQKLQRAAETALQAQLQKIETRPDFQNRQKYDQFDQIYRQWRKAQLQGSEDPAPKPEYLQGSVVVLDNESGAIRALVGGRDAQHSEFNRAMQGRRPAGSAFLPIVYAAGFESGLHPWSIVQDSPMDNRMVMVGETRGILGEWAREQANTVFEGPVQARTALIRGKTSASVRFGMMIGNDIKNSIDTVQNFSKAAGIDSPLKNYTSAFLGSSEVTPVELTFAYTSIAGGGSRAEAPYLIEKVRDRTGRVIYEGVTGRTNVFSVGAAYQVHECLTAALSEGTGAAAFTSLGLKRLPLAAKTGTTYNFADAWCVGYSSSISCGVWIGFDKPRDPIFFGAFGKDIALPVWTEVLNASFSSHPARNFIRPNTLSACKICSRSGFGVLPRCQEQAPGGQVVSTAIEAWLTTSQKPTPDEPCDIHGPKRPRRRHSGDSAIARAELVFEPGSVQPVALKSPTVLGVDPFQSLQAEETAKAVKNMRESGTIAPLDNKVPAQDKPEPQGEEIPKAVPVRPEEVPPSAPTPQPAPSIPKLDF